MQGGTKNPLPGRGYQLISLPARLIALLTLNHLFFFPQESSLNIYHPAGSEEDVHYLIHVGDLTDP